MLEEPLVSLSRGTGSQPCLLELSRAQSPLSCSLLHCSLDPRKKAKQSTGILKLHKFQIKLDSRKKNHQDSMDFQKHPSLLVVTWPFPSDRSSTSLLPSHAQRHLNSAQIFPWIFASQLLACMTSADECSILPCTGLAQAAVPEGET